MRIITKPNADKCQLDSSTKKVTFKRGSNKTGNTKREKLSGVHLNSELSFDYHIIEICKETICNVCALGKVT